MSRAWTWAALLWLALGGLALLGGCHANRASAADCERILDRIVELELRERGFHDPALLERKRAQVRGSFGAALRACVGRPLKPAALACIAEATSTEQVSHRCLH